MSEHRHPAARPAATRSWVPALLLFLTTLVLAIPVGVAGADHEGAEVITVNGQPFHGEGSPRLEGCTVVVAVSGLEDVEHELSLAIALTEPSGDAVLVSDGATVTGTSWEPPAYVMDDLVAGIEPAEHGYHIRVTVTIDGSAQTSRPFWLLCGAPAMGNPFRITFAKEWRYEDGTVLPGPPDVLDRDGYALDATSDRGSAHCVYPAGGDELVCTYVNGHGHEDETDALIVPAGKKFTFTVAETGLPEGWAPVAGIGTFSPREVCPFDGHDDEGEAAVLRADGPRELCVFSVVNAGPRPPVVPTTTSTTTSSTPPSAPTTGGAQVSPESLVASTTTTTSAPPALPATGRAGTVATVATGLAALVLGSLLVLWANRRRALA